MTHTIFIASDHAGFDLKAVLTKHLSEIGHSVVDKGAFEKNESDDYPDFVTAAAQAVAENPGSRGIVIGGSGQGEAICANRVKGIRAALYYGGNTEIIKLSREHNDSNILSLGARFISIEEAKEAVSLWLTIPFSNDERHLRRIAKLDK